MIKSIALEMKGASCEQMYSRNIQSVLRGCVFIETGLKGWGSSSECLPGIHKALGLLPMMDKSQVYWCMSVVPALGRWRQEDQRFRPLSDIFLTLPQRRDVVLTGEWAQLVMCFQKYRPVFIPQTHWKCQARWHTVITPVCVCVEGAEPDAP